MIRRTVLVGSMVCACAWAAPVAAQPPTTPALSVVRVVNADPVAPLDETVTVAGDQVAVPFGESSAPIIVPSAAFEVDFGSSVHRRFAVTGGVYDLVLGRPSGVAGPLEALLQRRPSGRLPDGTAGLRVVNTITSPSSMVITAGPQTVTVGAFTNGEYLVLPAGPSTIAVGPSPNSNIVQIDGEFRPNVAYTLLITGGGEIPPAAHILVDAEQPPAFIPPGTPVETGDRVPPPSPLTRFPVIGITIVSALLVVLGIRKTRLLALALLTLTTGCSQPGSDTDGDPVTSASLPSVPTTAENVDAPEPSTAPSPSHVSVLEIPRFGVTAKVEPLSLADLPLLTSTRDGTAVLPKEVVGEIVELATTTGSSHTFVGHNTSRGGHIAVFEQLPNIAQLDHIITDGSAQSDYTVTTIEQFTKGQLPATLWEPVPIGLDQIILITCSGGRDQTTGLRTHNTVVVAVRPAG